ncbi:MAG: hypothetical protein ACFFAU_18910 [Candidatus Hodarchaeota archaeon]
MEKSQITEEFEQRFGNLSSRINILQNSQSEMIKQYTQQLPDLIPIKIKKVISASYLLCLTEEIFEVTFNNFKTDFLVFSSFLGFEIEKSSEITDQYFIEAYLSPFVQILLTASDVFTEMLKMFIIEFATDYSQHLVRTLVIVTFYEPLFHKILNIIQKNIDLRFICAILTTTFENFIDRKSRLKKGVQLSQFSISLLYKEFVDQYPLGEGHDLIFDMCNKLALERTWYALEKLVKKEIEALSESIQTQREDSLTQYQANVAREKEKYSDGYYVTLITGRLFELFVLDRPITDNLRTGIVNAVDVMIRRYLIDQHGYASASADETLAIACNLLWETVWELPQIAASILEPHEVMEVMKSDNPRKWFKEREKMLKIRFCQLLTRFAGKKPLPALIGNAFVRILESVQQIKVRITFD